MTTKSHQGAIVLPPPDAPVPADPAADLAPETKDALLREMTAIFDDVDREIRLANPLCRQSGECCRFEAYGHRLYASRAEALYFLLRRGRPSEAFEHASCPYLKEGRCTARHARPLGCRAYFCDPGWKGKGEELTERTLKKIGALSDRLGIPWEYRPFLQHLDGFREVK